MALSKLATNFIILITISIASIFILSLVKTNLTIKIGQDILIGESGLYWNWSSFFIDLIDTLILGLILTPFLFLILSNIKNK